MVMLLDYYFEFLMANSSVTLCGAVLPYPTSAITTSGSKDVYIQLQVDFGEPMATQQPRAVLHLTAVRYNSNLNVLLQEGWTAHSL